MSAVDRDLVASPAKRSRVDNGPAHNTSADVQPAPIANGTSSRPRRTCLLVIDVQNDFCTGSLKAPDSLAIIPVINALRVKYAWDLVVFTADAHPVEHVSFYINHASDPKATLFQPYQLPSGESQVLWPVHCVRGTWGWKQHADLIRDPEHDVLVEKGTEVDQEFYSAFVCTDGVHTTNLAEKLRAEQITDVVAVGLCYEYCVGNSALDSAAAGFRTCVVTDATRGLTSEGMKAMTSKLDLAHVDVLTSADLEKRGIPQVSHAAASIPSNPPPPQTRALSARLDVASTSSSDGVAGGARRPQLLLGLSGSVATIKASELVARLVTWADVRVVCTGKARHFFAANELQQQFGVRVYQDEDEWTPWQRGDSVLHVELRKWADLMVVAPLSANTLAKIAGGLCDNLLTTVIRCWSFSTHPLLLAPAMNTVMWDSPFTRQHVSLVSSLGVRLVQPVEKRLACGDVGVGAMAEIDQIDAAARDAWNKMPKTEATTQQQQEETKTAPQ